MVEFELKVVPLEEPLELNGVETRTELNYRTEVLDLLRFFGAQGGIDMDEMEKALDVRAIFKSAENGAVIKLEKAQAEYVLGRLKAQKFAVADLSFVTFRKELQAAIAKG